MPDDLGIGGLIFADIGSIYNQSSSLLNIHDENKLRASAGIGISWLSPFGPVKFYLSKALLKENYDKKEILDLVWYNILNSIYKEYHENLIWLS